MITERPIDKAHWEAITPIIDSVSIPVIANGDLFTRQDIQTIREQTGVSSFMIARGALWNPSIFRTDGMLPLNDVICEYMRTAIRYGNILPNTK